MYYQDGQIEYFSSKFYETLNEIIKNSPIELTQLRIDYLFKKEYKDIIDDIIKNSPYDLVQYRIDCLEEKIGIY